MKMGWLEYLRFSEDGATFVENIIVVAFIVLPMAIIAEYCLMALNNYFEILSLVATLPFP